jgi:hypothetical protein
MTASLLPAKPDRDVFPDLRSSRIVEALAGIAFVVLLSSLPSTAAQKNQGVLAELCPIDPTWCARIPR